MRTIADMRYNENVKKKNSHCQLQYCVMKMIVLSIIQASFNVFPLISYIFLN